MKAITFIVMKVSKVTSLRTFPGVCVIEVSTTMQLNDASFSQLRVLAFFIVVLMVSQSIANLLFKH